MNDEIKEILDKLSKEENFIQHSYCRLFNYEVNTLLDYITNLQQENEVLENEKDIFYKVSEERLNKWLSLNDENNKLVEIIKDYKSRIEKAVEKIKKIQQNAIKYGAEHDVIICQELIDILNGRSDE